MSDADSTTGEEGELGVVYMCEVVLSELLAPCKCVKHLLSHHAPIGA